MSKWLKETSNGGYMTIEGNSEPQNPKEWEKYEDKDAFLSRIKEIRGV